MSAAACDTFLELLISEVEKHPALYDVTSAQYKNKLMKDNIWRNISASLNVDARILQTKWKSVRDRHTRERRDESSEKRSGAGAYDKKPWALMRYLTFLNRFVEPRPTVTNFKSVQHFMSSCDSRSPTPSVASDIIIDDYVAVNDFHTYALSPNSPQILCTSPPHSSSSMPNNLLSRSLLQTPSPSPPPPPLSSLPVLLPDRTSKYKRKSAASPDTQAEDEILKKIKALDNEQTQKMDYTEDELFLLSLAPGMSRLPPKERAILQIKFKTLLTEAEFGPL